MLVDLSQRGILVETTSRMTLGSTLDLQFVGQNTDISIPARVLRSDIATVDGLGVKSASRHSSSAIWICWIT